MGREIAWEQEWRGLNARGRGSAWCFCHGKSGSDGRALVDDGTSKPRNTLLWDTLRACRISTLRAQQPAEIARSRIAEKRNMMETKVGCNGPRRSMIVSRSKIMMQVNVYNYSRGRNTMKGQHTKLSWSPPR